MFESNLLEVPLLNFLSRPICFLDTDMLYGIYHGKRDGYPIKIFLAFQNEL